MLLTLAYSFQSRSFREAKEEMNRFHSSTYGKPYLIEATAQYLVAHLPSSVRDVECMVQRTTSLRFGCAFPLQALNQSLSLQIESLTVKTVFESFQVSAHSSQGSLDLFQ
jgi:hypothetical protein